MKVGAGYFLPFRYLFKTRLKGSGRRCSWLLIYFVPQLVSVGLLASVNWQMLIAWFMVSVAVYLVYELGYMYNDSFTILKEDNPTTRLDYEEAEFLRSSYVFIVVGRIVLVAFCLFIYSAIFPDSYAFYIQCWIISSLVVLFFIFYIYNNWRSFSNLYLHFLMVLIRYALPVIAVVPESASEVLLAMLFGFALPNTLERITESKYMINPEIMSRVRDKLPLLRIAYYLLLVLFVSCTGEGILLYVVLYFLCVRLIFVLVGGVRLGVV